MLFVNVELLICVLLKELAIAPPKPPVSLLSLWSVVLPVAVFPTNLEFDITKLWLLCDWLAISPLLIVRLVPIAPPLNPVSLPTNSVLEIVVTASIPREMAPPPTG